ncbi:MAG: family 20 glycosylhydrolase [Clostridia bacterium]|nr:family 20 glycosylhydrolase [Clostridia bacterium]
MFLVPRPQNLTIKEEFLSANGFKVESDKEFSFFAPFCTGETLIEVKKADYSTPEKYEIKIDKDGISVKYADDEAAFRAYTTLKQIISWDDKKLPCLDIEDEPSIKNRGYMLDISRGKIPNIEYLKELVDLLSDLKYNQLQLYMESFVYEYKGFEEYWKDTQPLTEAEIRELDAYCKEKFINLVPLQNSFGHMGAWTAKEEIAPLAITGKNGKPSQTLNPFLPESLELIDKIYEGLLPAFTSTILNIGMDEPHELGLNETKEECDKRGVGNVYTEYLNKVIDLASEKYGMTPMFFDDIVFKHPEQLANIPKNAIVMQWGYETEHHYDRNCRLLSEQGLRFYVCPGTSMWGSLTGRMNNMVVNITNAAESGAYYGAEGFLLTEWGDDGHPQMPYTTYFPLVVGGYASWNCGNHNNEIAYGERRQMLYAVTDYLDKFVYRKKSKKSVADIVYRMGNFYILEELMFNGTQINQSLMRRHEVNEVRRTEMERILKYMTDMRAELDEVDAKENVMDELKCNCEIVIVLAKVLLGKYDKDECEKLFSEYHRLWILKNHEAGAELFPDLVKGWMN